MSGNFDIIIIGSGPGGYTTALRASQLGAKVALIEKAAVGGVCLNRGCIPTKSFVENLKAVEKAKSILGPQASLALSLDKLVAKKDTVINNSRKGLEFLFKTNKISLFSGRAKVIDKQTVEVDAVGVLSRLTAKNIVVATGSRPIELKEIPLNDKNIITSDQAFSLESVPRRILIAGAGAIGCEFAQIFHYLGAEVHLLEMAEQILPEADQEVARLLEQSLTGSGVRIHTKSSIAKVEDQGIKLKVTLKNDEELEVDCLICAFGRRANVENLGLENLGIEIDCGRIKVNERLETKVSGIYAIGDCVFGPMLAHKASYDGVLVAENIFGGKNLATNYDNIPKCIFSYPEIGMVGLTQTQAEKTTGIKIGKFPFSANGRAQVLGETKGFVKIIARENDGKILGGQVIGPQAAELVNLLVLAMSNELKASDFTNTVFAHPTLSESLKEAVEDLAGKAIGINRKR